MALSRLLTWNYIPGHNAQWGIIMTFGIEITISDFLKLLKYLIYILFWSQNTLFYQIISTSLEITAFGT